MTIIELRTLAGLDAQNLWVLEWSPTQRFFHIQTLMDTLEANQGAFSVNRKSDWITLMIYTSHDAAHKGADDLQNTGCGGAKALNKILQ